MVAEHDCSEPAEPEISLTEQGETGPKELNATTARRGTESSAPSWDIFPHIFLFSNKALKNSVLPSIQWSQSALQMLIRVKPHKTTEVWESAVIPL